MKRTTPISRFLFPTSMPGRLVRAIVVVSLAGLFLTKICTPIRIIGISMEPTYRNGRFNFCWRPRYAFSGPVRGERVIIRWAGSRATLLKRVVGLEGDTVEFHGGTLWINNAPVAEPYVVYPCLWDMAPLTVANGHLYVVGDNRRMPIDEHVKGQVERQRIMGGPLW